MGSFRDPRNEGKNRSMPESDPFLSDLYDRLHQTPMQEKLRRIRPIPVGVVFIEWPGMTMEDIRRHFRMMKDLGFTCLKGLMLCPETDRRAVEHLALDEGLIPWWYDEAGWEDLTDELLEGLGISPDAPPEEIRQNSRLRAHQDKLMRERIDRGPPPRGLGRDREEDELFSFDMDLSAKAVGKFVAFLRETYGTIEALNEAWNVHHAGIPGAGGRHGRRGWESWEELEAALPEAIGTREYRRIRDVIRFKADLMIARIRRRCEAVLEHDPHAPTRAGGEMGLFLPFAARATDMEGIAGTMSELGSFYPSIHLAWHFEEVDFEIVRPVYMQASLVQDWMKGGWTAAWESTGGPQHLSGAKGWTPEAAVETAGFTVDGGVMTQLMLSYLAAGFRGFGFWCWNARTAGLEAGEYALLDRNLEPSSRALQAGRIGHAAQRLRDELWQTRKEPVVGLFQDFENDAMWAALSVHNRDKYRHTPVQARIGAARALIDANVPWEHVTAGDLRSGLAARYKSIYLPAVLNLPADLVDILAAYVEAGGRLVLDLPGAWLDEYGRLLATGPGTPFERIFGCTVRDMQYARNVPRSIEGRPLGSFVADLGLTKAKVVLEYDQGGPAVTEAECGKGTACVLAYEASLMCRRPGNTPGEARLVRFALGPHTSPYACREAIVYRLAAPEADHYFLINDGEAVDARLDTKAFRYARITDAVSEEELEPGAPIALPRYGGRWLRFEK